MLDSDARGAGSIPADKYLRDLHIFVPGSGTLILLVSDNHDTGNSSVSSGLHNIGVIFRKVYESKKGGVFDDFFDIQLVKL